MADLTDLFDQLNDLINTDKTPANTLTLTDVTVTVGSGKDFATIQEAIDWFKGKIVSGSCIIAVDAGTYAENIEFSSIQVMPGASLILQGDTRSLAGLTYVDHAYGANSEARTNGGATDAACALANSTTNITVTVTGGDPDFDADNWVSGNLVLVLDNSAVATEKTISSTSNKTITLTATAPTIGNTGSAICLCPNRVISVSSGNGITINSSGIQVVGFYIKSSASSGYGAYTPYDYTSFTNCVTYKFDYGFYLRASNSTSKCSAWGPGTYCFNFLQSYCALHYLTAILGIDGFVAHMYTYSLKSKAVSASFAGFYTLYQNFFYLSYCSAINNNIGFRAITGSILQAALCNARSVGNVTLSSTDTGFNSIVSIT